MTGIEHVWHESSTCVEYTTLKEEQSMLEVVGKYRQEGVTRQVVPAQCCNCC